MSNNTNNTEDLSFLEEENGGMQFKDILMLVVRNLPWFILCALIGGGLAFYKVKSQEKVYASTTSVMLKTGNSGGSESFRSSAIMSQFTGQGVAYSSIPNEIIIMKSQTLMEQVVRKLGLHTSYSYTHAWLSVIKHYIMIPPLRCCFPMLVSN